MLLNYTVPYMISNVVVFALMGLLCLHSCAVGAGDGELRQFLARTLYVSRVFRSALILHVERKFQF